MRDFQQKRQIRKIFYSAKTAFLLLIFFLIVGQGLWGVYKKERDSRQNLEKVELEYEKMKERELFLKNEIERLNTEDGIESEIREKFSVTMPGEEVVLIVDSQNKTEEENIEKETFWQKFIGFFKR